MSSGLNLLAPLSSSLSELNLTHLRPLSLFPLLSNSRLFPNELTFAITQLCRAVSLLSLALAAVIYGCRRRRILLPSQSPTHKCTHAPTGTYSMEHGREGWPQILTGMRRDTNTHWCVSFLGDFSPLNESSPVRSLRSLPPPLLCSPNQEQLCSSTVVSHSLSGNLKAINQAPLCYSTPLCVCASVSLCLSRLSQRHICMHTR